jgi:N-methylhydantoinase A
LGQAFDALEQRCRADLGASDSQSAQVQVERWVEMRYVGQAYELPVAAPLGGLQASHLARFEAEFHAVHERTYGHRTDNVMEIVNLRVVCRIPNAGSPPSAYAGSTNGRAPARGKKRPAYFGPEHGVCETPVLRREDLSDAPLPGPVIIEEYDATVVVPPDCSAARDVLGNIVIEVEP